MHCFSIRKLYPLFEQVPNGHETGGSFEPTMATVAEVIVVVFIRLFLVNQVFFFCLDATDLKLSQLI